MSIAAVRPPGVYAEMTTRPGVTTTTGAASGQYLCIGTFSRGRTDAAVLVRSLGELVEVFGPRTASSAAWDSLESFFVNGGAQARVLRVVGPAATLGTLTLKDRATPAVNTLRIDALGAGAWSAGLTVEVAAGSAAGTVRLLVRLGDQVEVFDNASTPADLANKLNASRWVRGVDLGSVTASPNNLPAILAPAALSAGADDLAAVDAAALTAALPKLDSGLGIGAVGIPGQSAAVVGAALIAHAKATQRVAAFVPPVGTTVSGVVAMAQGLTTADGGYAALVYPWIRTSIHGAPGNSQLIGGEGYFAAMRSRAHTADGPWGQAAGTPAISANILDVERDLTDDERATLNAAGVSVIRKMTGGIRLYGYRSLSTDVENYGQLSDQDSMNYLYARCTQALEPFVFAPLTSATVGQAKAALIAICDDIRARGGALERYVPGDRTRLIDPGYAVDVTTNPAQPNTLLATVALRLPGHAEFVRLTLTRVAATAAIA